MKKDEKVAKKKSMGKSILGQMFSFNRQNVSLIEEQVQSPFRTMFKNFLQNKIALIGLITFVLIFASCFILPIFFPLDVNFQDVTQQNIAPGFSMLNIPKELNGDIKQIDEGATFGVGISKKGKTYIWGKLDKKLKNMPDMNNITQVSAGINHVLALDNNGKLYTWGYDRLRLNKIPLELKNVKNIKQIEAGHQISFVLTDDGKIVHWGNDNLISLDYKKYQGQIEKIVANTTTLLAITKDKKVVALSQKETPFSNIDQSLNNNVLDIASTDKTAIALKKDGTVMVWGADNIDAFGTKDIPKNIQGKVKQISAGRSHFTALLTTGEVVCWGRNNFNQCSISSAINKKNDTQQISSGYYQNYAIDQNGKAKTWGLKGYLFGTDGYGRDIFSRLIAGGRMTMTIGAIAVIISTIIGVIVGGFAGYYGGKTDNFLMRFAEIISSIPFLPFAMILSSFLGNSISETGRISIIMVILGVLSWTGLARLVRAEILAQREKEFVTSAKAVGIKELSIIFKHILPNVITVVIVNTTLNFATCMLTESALSFLGFGVVEPKPTWGNMLTGSQSSTVISTYWWRWIFPSLALSFSTISINLIGDGLRDAIDPRSNER
ncbi:MAG: ABC transporter permease subunit [Oscillospiraceae bacterium]